MRDLQWNIGSPAAAYSALSAVLAGFLVSMLVLLLSIPPRGKKAKDVSSALYGSLLSAVFSLLLSSLMWALISGEKAQVRPFVLEVCASATFAFGAVLLFLSLCWCFVEYDLPDDAQKTARALFIGVLLITPSYVAVAFGDVERVQAGIRWYTDRTFDAVAMISVLVPSIITFALRDSTSLDRSAWAHKATRCAFIITLCLAVAFAYLADQEDSFFSGRPSVTLVWAARISFYVGILVFGAALILAGLGVPQLGSMSSKRQVKRKPTGPKPSAKAITVDTAHQDHEKHL